jgi:hypothetical protein
VTSVHLPAINTPQFRWVKSRLEKKSQPVPPIFQPEVAVEGILFAIDHARRELWVGWPTVKTIIGARLVPWYLDHYLATEAYDGQQLDEPYEDRPHNLWEPVPGDHGAHGVFDDDAQDRSTQLWLSRHRRVIGAAVLGLAGAAITALLRRRSNGNGDVAAANGSRNGAMGSGNGSNDRADYGNTGGAAASDQTMEWRS